jgi:hypothetical protein
MNYPERFWARVILSLFAAAVIALLAVLVCAIVGCAPLDYVISRHPVTGDVPAVAALAPAASAGLDALTTGGIITGVLAFVGTYTKTLLRVYARWRQSK